MQTEQTAALTNTPAIVLALVLLGAMAVASVQVAQYVLLAPGTLLPATPSKPVAQLRPAAATGLQPSEAFTEMASGPGWETLSTPQKLALYPLAERWAVLSESQKRRWLALAQTFETLPPEEQEKLHNRMTEWSSLSARQRSQARLNYADAQRLAPNDKRAHWEAYQALSDEEKRSLAADAPTKPAGAAPALRPESPKKLVQVPAAAAGRSLVTGLEGVAGSSVPGARRTYCATCTLATAMAPKSTKASTMAGVLVSAAVCSVCMQAVGGV